MSHFGSSDFLIEVAKGKIPGHSLVHKFGRNAAIANGSWELIGLLSGAAAHRSSAATVRVKAGGDAADAAAGNGAREVTVQGIDSALAETSEAITMNADGTLASAATTASFWRVHRAWVSAVGTYHVGNTAAVTIEDSGGAADMLQIAATHGQSEYAGWTVPTGKTGYLLSVNITVDSGQDADFRLMTCADFNDTAGAMSSLRVKKYWAGINDRVNYTPRSPDVTLAALTDIWIEGQGAGGNTIASADFELLVVDD